MPIAVTKAKIPPLLTETHDGVIKSRHWTETHCELIADSRNLFNQNKTQPLKKYRIVINATTRN